MEYLPESLVLLKRKMGWELKDVLYLPHGVIESYAEKRPSYDPDLQKVPLFFTITCKPSKVLQQCVCNVRFLP